MRRKLTGYEPSAIAISASGQKYRLCLNKFEPIISDAGGAVACCFWSWCVRLADYPAWWATPCNPVVARWCQTSAGIEPGPAVIGTGQDRRTDEVPNTWWILATHWSPGLQGTFTGVAGTVPIPARNGTHRPDSIPGWGEQ